MANLKITAIMQGEIAGELPMLDAVLTLVMSRHHPAAVGRGESVPLDKLDAIPIPIHRSHDTRLPIPQCSGPIADVGMDRHDHYHTSFCAERVDLIAPGRRRIITSGSGPQRSYRLPLRVRIIPRIVWFAVGGRRGVKIACSQVEFLGKKTSYGYGKVAQWMIEEVDNDYSWFAPSEAGTLLMRPMPAGESLLPSDLVGYRSDYGSPLPPYWQRDLYQEIIVPC